MIFQERLIDTLNAEWIFFGKDMAGSDKTMLVGGKTRRKEEVEPFASRIGDYWLSLPTTAYSSLVRSSAGRYGKLDGTINIPWSAAFISYGMQAAGAGSQFPYAAGHATWIVKSIANRLAGKTKAALVGYRIDEHPLAVGDLIGTGRAGANVSYDNAVGKGWFTSHSDVIVEIDLANRLAYAIGGNVSQTVAKTPITLDSSGRLADTRRPWMVHIRNNIRTAEIATASADAQTLQVG